MKLYSFVSWEHPQVPLNDLLPWKHSALLSELLLKEINQLKSQSGLHRRRGKNIHASLSSEYTDQVHQDANTLITHTRAVVIESDLFLLRLHHK